MNSQEMIQLFLEETIDRLNEMSSSLLELEKDSVNDELIAKLFRVAHTIKGNASTAHNTLIDMDSTSGSTLVHIEKMAKMTHALEGLIMEARDNGLELNPDRIELLFEASNSLETLVQYIESGSEEDCDVEDLKERLYAASKGAIAPVSPKLPAGGPSYKDVFEIHLSCDESFKHAFLSLVYKDIEDRYPQAVFDPSFDDLMVGVEFKNVFVKFESFSSPDEFVAFVNGLESVEKTVLLGAASAPKKEEPAKSEAPAVQEAPKPAPAAPAKEVEKKAPASPASSKSFYTNTNIKVAISRIDEQMKHVSSLVILKNKLSTLANVLSSEELKAIKDVSEEISQTVDFLQESVMKIRMTPLEQLFSRFPKDVRNISKEFKKDVDFQTFGGETEIDKSLLDELFDPLMHLIRNSIFHGLESPDSRIAAGKKPQGKLILSAKHEQSSVVISVEDDGAGIDTDKVVRKAIEKGLITEEKARATPKQELNNLIYHPGLSTADAVNSVAGRGVGMDAVRSKIEEMKGTIQVVSELGKGTKTIIRLPLTLAIIQAMLTKIDGNHFAFPLGSVESVEIINASEIKHISNKEVYVLRGKEIPLLRLNHYFGIGDYPKNQKQFYAVVLKLGDRLIGATVDQFLGQEDIVVKNIGRYLGNIQGISGCNILGNGDISLIVDVNSLFKKGI